MIYNFLKNFSGFSSGYSWELLHADDLLKVADIVEGLLYMSRYAVQKESMEVREPRGNVGKLKAVAGCTGEGTVSESGS